MIDERVMAAILQSNLGNLQKLRELTDRRSEFGTLSDKQLAIVAVMFGAALAKLTELRIEDYTALCVYAYQNIDIDPLDTTEEHVGNA